MWFIARTRSSCKSMVHSQLWVEGSWWKEEHSPGYHFTNNTLLPVDTHPDPRPHVKGCLLAIKDHLCGKTHTSCTELWRLHQGSSFWLGYRKPLIHEAGASSSFKPPSRKTPGRPRTPGCIWTVYLPSRLLSTCALGPGP